MTSKSRRSLLLGLIAGLAVVGRSYSADAVVVVGAGTLGSWTTRFDLANPDSLPTSGAAESRTSRISDCVPESVSLGHRDHSRKWLDRRHGQ
jgi:hypothetical protein